MTFTEPKVGLSIDRSGEFTVVTVSEGEASALGIQVDDIVLEVAGERVKKDGAGRSHITDCILNRGRPLQFKVWRATEKALCNGSLSL